MKKLFCALSIVIFFSCVYKVAHATMSTTKNLSKEQIENVNALMFESEYSCDGSSDDPCIYICKQCGAIVGNPYSTGWMNPNNRPKCSQCGK